MPISEAKPPRPFVPPHEAPAELTLRALVVGSLLGIVFAASSVYLALKVGLTVSASIPIAVLSITVFRAFGRASILENNVVQTAGSAGESIAAGVAFTLPSLLLMGFGLDPWRTTWVALLGGALGVLLMVPLRRGLVVREHATLPYPEGTACAQVLIVGERGGTSARTVFGGFVAGGVFQLLAGLGRFFAEVASWSFDRVFRGASFSLETSPALLGVGYVIGTRIALVMLAGGMLSFLVLVPAVHAFGPDLVSPLVGASRVAVHDMSPGQIRSAFLLYVGAGAVATGGLIGLLRSLPSMFSAFGAAARGLAGGVDHAGRLRTDHDLPIGAIALGVLALFVAIVFAPGLGMNLATGALVVLFGFFFVTVSSRITGQIGSSSNPISGMTVATLLATCLIFVAADRVGISAKELALSTAALVCVAASNGGTISQDLKTGFLVGATPWRQQVAILVGVATSALVIGLTLTALDRGATTIVPRSFPAFDPVAAVAHARAEGDALRVLQSDEPMTFRGASWPVLEVRRTIEGVPVGRYLLDTDGRIAHLVDPGVCGVEPEQRDAEGRVEKVVSKFDAPKAQLFRLIIDGVLDRDLPWPLVLIGVFVALVMELCAVPSLAFAVGVYLPLSTSTAIALGGAVRALADRRARRSEADEGSSPGVLFSSGLIAGGAIAGLIVAALAGIETERTGSDGRAHPVSLVRALGLELAPRLFGAETARSLVESATLAALAFLVLAGLLFVVASRRSSEDR